MEHALHEKYLHLYPLPNNVLENADVYERKIDGQLVLVKRIFMPENATE